MKRFIIAIVIIAVSIITSVTYSWTAPLYEGKKSEGSMRDVDRDSNSVTVEFERDKDKNKGSGSSSGGSSSSNKSSGGSGSSTYTTPKPGSGNTSIVKGNNGGVVTVRTVEVKRFISSTTKTEQKTINERNPKLLHYNWYFTNKSSGESFTRTKEKESIREKFTAGEWQVVSIPVYKWEYGYSTRTYTEEVYEYGIAMHFSDGRVITQWNGGYTREKTNYSAWKFTKLGEKTEERSSGKRVFEFIVSLADVGKYIDIPMPDPKKVGVDFELIR